MSETTEKKTKEKIVDVTKLRFKVRLPRNASGEENFQYVCNGARGVQVKRGVDVNVPFAVREALRMADDARMKQERYLETEEAKLEAMSRRMGG